MRIRNCARRTSADYRRAARTDSEYTKVLQDRVDGQDIQSEYQREILSLVYKACLFTVNLESTSRELWDAIEDKHAGIFCVLLLFITCRKPFCYQVTKWPIIASWRRGNVVKAWRISIRHESLELAGLFQR